MKFAIALVFACIFVLSHVGPSYSACSGSIKLLVPLYIYPGAAWDTVVASAGVDQTVAIINPDSGPGNGTNSDYKKYIPKLVSAKIDIVGYVHTSYGARSLTEVQADIKAYSTKFTNIVGIFLDEAAAAANEVAYYTTLHQYILGIPGFKYVILNPGAAPTQGYYDISTHIVAFEDTSSKFAASTGPSFASCSNRDHFVAIAYGASSSSFRSVLDEVKSKGIYGWVYVTDGAGGCCTYNKLASYYAAEATYIANITHV